jgi:hypothetical protein
MSQALSHAVKGASTRRAASYAAVAAVLLVLGLAIASLDGPTGRRLGLGVGLVLTAGAVAVVQAHRNGSAAVSLALTLAPALGIVGGLGGLRAGEFLVPAVLLGTFLGATSYLLGQQFGDSEDERAVTVTIAALLVGSALLFALRLPLP